jgi:hypothetical protein
MTLLAGLLPKLGALAQPTVLAAGVATGVAVGTVGVATGVIPVAEPAPRNVAIYECPGSGRVVTSIKPNQNVLVTARSADSQWLQIYIGEAAADRGWAPASALELKAAPDGLPVEDCTPEATGAPLPTSLEPPSAVPSPGATESVAPTSAVVPATPGPGATPSPTPAPTKTPKPTPTPAPTPTAHTGPTLTAFALNPFPGDWYIDEDPPGSGQYPIYQVGCTIGDWTVGFYIEAQDPDGIASATLYYKPQGVSVPIEETMGEEGPGEYYREVVTDEATWYLGEVDYWITVIDGVGDSTTFTGPSNKRIVYTLCND